MKKADYDLFRLLRYIDREEFVKKSSLTTNIIGRKIYRNMKDLNAGIDAHVEAGRLTSKKDYSANLIRGFPPQMFYVTAAGREWLKKMENE